MRSGNSSLRLSSQSSCASSGSVLMTAPLMWEPPSTLAVLMPAERRSLSRMFSLTAAAAGLAITSSKEQSPEGISIFNSGLMSG